MSSDAESPVSPGDDSTKSEHIIAKLETQKSIRTKKTAKDDVAAQTEMFNSGGNIWSMVKEGNIEGAMKMIDENPELIWTRGFVGEIPLHLCFLFNAAPQKEIARQMIRKEKKCITAIYENPIYAGETCLHIAIVNKDLPTAKWLVAEEPKLLTLPATGTFFQGESPCYYGEYPFSFAVCTNNLPMVTFLIKADANMWQQDSSGNNVLHMCVIHNLQRMYEFLIGEEQKLLDAKKAAGEKLPTPLSRALNKEKLTPLTFAAFRGNKDMFDFIFQKQKEIQWTYGPVSCTIFPLEELDSLREEEHEDPPPTALEIIVKEEHLELLMLPRIVDLLHQKWKAYAGRYFYKRCIMTSFYVVMLSIAVILRSPDFTYDFTDWHDGLRVVTEIFVVLGWFYKGSKEVRELFSSGLEYFNQSGSAFLENNLSFLFLVSLPLAVICEAAGSRVKLFFVFCTALWLWTYELTLLLGFRLTGPFVIMIYKMLSHDIARFASIYILILFGHAAAWYVIEMPTGVQTPFDEFFDRLISVFMIMFGQISFEDFAWSMFTNYDWLSSLLLIFHVVFVFIMLLNVLIGMMGDTYHDIKDNADQEWHLAYSQIIFSCESEIPKEKLQRCCYWTTITGKRYLQVQDVDAEYFKEFIDDAEQTRSIVQEALAKLDLNQDGQITIDEIEAGERKAEETGEILTLTRADSPMKDEGKDKSGSSDPEKVNLGVTDHLEGRLDPSLTSL